MKLRWKDFLYFQRGDKNAIILLCILIVLCGGVCIFSESLFSNKNKTESDEAYIEFDKFQKGLTDITPISDQKKEKEEPKVKTNQTKKLTTGETIDINTADLKIFKRIPGIGDEYARRIEAYRNKLGGFTSIEQLMEVDGISSKRFDKISGYTIIRKQVRKINVNKPDLKQFQDHPYINDNQANAILRIKESAGNLQSIDDLSALPEFTTKDIARLSGYLHFD